MKTTRSLLDLYGLAEQNRIAVKSFDLGEIEAMSAMARKGKCGIAIDLKSIKGEQDEKVKLAHELGHCMTGSFYNIYSTCDIRGRHETRANRWAYRNCLPFDELNDAICRGNNTYWELAEYLDWPEWFIREAVAYYTEVRRYRFGETDQQALYEAG